MTISVPVIGAADAAKVAGDLRAIEREYADFLDARSATVTINSGLIATVGGHDHTAAATFGL